MKKVLFLTSALIMSTMMWAETATSNFTDKHWNVGEGEQAWVAAGAEATGFESASPSRGVQTTLAKIKESGLTLTNTSIKDLGGISKVEILYSSNCGGSSDGTIAVTVGSTAFGDAFTIKKENNATISFENATAVEGDIVITFTSTATSKSIYVKSITVTYGGITPQRTLQSIYIDGEATKLEYKEGESFDPAGLKVMGVYDSGEDTEITADIDWLFDPEVFAIGDESVDVLASVETFTSEVFTVNGIVVKEFVKTYANTYTSNVELVENADTKASAAKVSIEETEYDAIKAGTGKAAGACVVTIPANTKTLHFHAAGWNGEEVTLDVNGTEYSLVADAGVSGSSPFTLTNDPETQDYFTLDPKGATTITFTATSGNRFVLFGVNAEEGGISTALQEVMENANVSKQLINGQLIIIRDNVRYNVAGQQL